MDTNTDASKLKNVILTSDLLIQDVSLNNPKPEVLCVTVHCVHEEPSPSRSLGINCLLSQGLWLFPINLNSINQL